MKTLLRIFVVFGTLDLIVAGLSLVRGEAVSGKVILGFGFLIVGSTGLFILNRIGKE